MTTRSAGRATAAPRGGRTGGRTGIGGGRTRGRSGDKGNGGIDGQGGQVGGQGNEVIDGVNGVPDFFTIIAQQLQNLLPTILAQEGGVIVYTHWIEKMKSVQDMSRREENQKVKYTAGLFVNFETLTREEFCLINEMQKLETEFWNYAMVRAGHAVYNDRSMSWLDKAVRNVSLKKNPKKRGNGKEPNRDWNARDENNRTRTGNAFATTTNPMRREYNDTIHKCVSCNLHHPPEMPCWACFNCGRPGHMTKDCRVAHRMVNPVNARNPTAALGACYEYGGTDHFKATCPRLNQAQRPGGNRPNCNTPKIRSQRK
ncbi:reverse transcriptase domain-containing protein, partial [Tanacetum coccineum]